LGDKNQRKCFVGSKSQLALVTKNKMF